MTVEMLFGALGLVVSRILFRHFPTLPGKEGNVDASQLSVIIPARNEAQTLPDLLPDLSRQTVTPLEIICVDDASTDDTASIATAHGAKVVPARDRPSGWLGKPWRAIVGCVLLKANTFCFWTRMSGLLRMR